MGLEIRLVDPNSERELLMDTLKRFLTPTSDSKRFDWLYLDNPFGKARVWISREMAKGSVAGMAAAFPRRVWVNGKSEIGWVLGDFCLNPQYRSLGPALALQRECLKEINQAYQTFCYDFPSQVMMAIYRRMGMKAYGNLVRLAKPLRIDRKVRKFVKREWVVQGLSLPGNLLLKARDHKVNVPAGITFDFFKEPFGDEFTRLDKEIVLPNSVCLQRSAEYLNWHYLQNPLYQFEVFTARKEGVLQGYLIFYQNGEDGTIVDLRCVPETSHILTLIDRVTDTLRGRKVMTVSLPIFESHPWTNLFQSRGFVAREESPVVVYAPGNTDMTQDSCKWFLMYGDRDS